MATGAWQVLTRPRSTNFFLVFIALIAGGSVLLAANIIMDPVPVSAGPAFAGGAAGFFFLRAQPQRLVINLAVIGATIGLLIHRNWHLSGQNPPPAEGLIQHLGVEGLIGLFAALLALAVTGLVLKLFEERRRDPDDMGKR